MCGPIVAICKTESEAGLIARHDATHLSKASNSIWSIVNQGHPRVLLSPWDWSQ